MINELYSIYQGLKDVGKEPEIKHNDIAAPGMGTTFRVCLDENSVVSSIELMSKEKIKDTWSLGNGNKNQFPAAKLEVPLIPDAHSKYKTWRENNKNPAVDVFRKFIQDQLNNHPIKLPECWPSYREKIEERAGSLKEKLLQNIQGQQIYGLFSRYLNVSENGVALLAQFIDKLKILMNQGGKEELKAIADVLFGDGDTLEKGKVKDGKRVALLIDYRPRKDIDECVSSRSNVSALSEALFACEENSKPIKGKCAVTGCETELSRDKFPSQKLSVIGPTIILAKSETSGLTVKRYDKSGTDAYQLGKFLGDKLAASIASLTTDKLKNKTWTTIPSSGARLLLAYCKGKFELAIIPMITGGDIEDFDDYKNATKTALNLFRKSNCTPDDAVNICEIRKVNDGNRQINYSAISSIGKISSAAKEWVKACKNVPDFKLLAKVNNSSKLLNPWAIAPIEVINLTKNKYIRDGLSSTSVNSLNFSDTMALFMSSSDNVKILALRTIEKLSNQVEPLFEYCALSKIQWKLEKKKQRFVTKPDKNSLTLKTVTLLGVLLFKAGRTKEIYMSSFAYQLGQLCSAMDELHIGYCQDMRKGDIPNALLGNSIYKMALQNSEKALGMLSSRMAPYTNWAKKTLNKNKDMKSVADEAVKSGLYAHLWMKKQSSFINDSLLKKSEAVSDTYKAELMLGYLAGRSFDENNSNISEQGDEQ